MRREKIHGRSAINHCIHVIDASLSESLVFIDPASPQITIPYILPVNSFDQNYDRNALFNIEYISFGFPIGADFVTARVP